MTLRRDPLSDLFVITCDTCGTRVHVDSDMGIGAAQVAARAGWVVGPTDHCRDCPPPTPARRTR